MRRHARDADVLRGGAGGPQRAKPLGLGDEARVLLPPPHRPPFYAELLGDGGNGRALDEPPQRRALPRGQVARWVRFALFARLRQTATFRDILRHWLDLTCLTFPMFGGLPCHVE